MQPHRQHVPRDGPAPVIRRAPDGRDVSYGRGAGALVSDLISAAGLPRRTAPGPLPGGEGGGRARRPAGIAVGKWPGGLTDHMAPGPFREAGSRSPPDLRAGPRGVMNWLVIGAGPAARLGRLPRGRGWRAAFRAHRSVRGGCTDRTPQLPPTREAGTGQGIRGGSRRFLVQIPPSRRHPRRGAGLLLYYAVEIWVRQPDPVARRAIVRITTCFTKKILQYPSHRIV